VKRKIIACSQYFMRRGFALGLARSKEAIIGAGKADERISEQEANNQVTAESFFISRLRINSPPYPSSTLSLHLSSSFQRLRICYLNSPSFTGQEGGARDGR